VNKIKDLRKSAGLSQTTLAKILHVHQSAIGQWETERTFPDIENLKKLSSHFDVSIDYILGHTNNPNSENVKSPVYDDEALAILEELHKNPNYKLLCHTSRNVKASDLAILMQMADRMSEEYRD